MQNKKFLSAESAIKKQIKFALQKFQHPIGEFELFPDCLKAQEYKYDNQAFFVLIAQLKIPNQNQFYDVPVCIDANELEDFENISPLLFIHSDIGFIKHVIKELGGGVSSMTYRCCNKTKSLLMIDGYSVNSHNLYGQYINFLDYFHSVFIDERKSIVPDLSFKGVSVFYFLRTLLIDDLMFQELYLVREVHNDLNSFNSVDRLKEINHSIYEILDEESFKLVMQKVNDFSQEYGYTPPYIGEKNPSVLRTDYLQEQGSIFAAEIYEILRGTTFLEFLYKLSVIELSALSLMGKGPTNSISILVLSLMFAKKRSSVSYTSYLTFLSRLNNASYYQHLGHMNDLNAQVYELEISLGIEGKQPSKEDLELRQKIHFSEMTLKHNYNTLIDYIKYVQPSSDKQSLENLIGYGESKTLEFKATAKYSMDAKADDKNLYYPIIKSICAFGNTDGGILVVGFHELTNEFTGIEKDGFKDNDKWENYIRNHLDQKAGKFIGTLFDISYKSYKSKTVALINVRKSSKRIYCSDIANPKSQNFYVRTGAYTKALGLEEAIEFITSHNLD